MKNIRFVLAIIFLGSLAVSLTTCAGSLALNGIVVTPANPSIPTGSTQQFTATGYYNDQTNHDITTQVTWSSSDTSVATIDSTTGLAIAVSVGAVTITATSTAPNSFSTSSTSASTTLTATSATLSSIAVTPANQSIPVGALQQFTATATYNNGKSNDITTQVTWTSSDTTVATISSTGLAIFEVVNGYALSAGTTTITATSGSISGSTTLTVLTVNSATLSSIAVTPVVMPPWPITPPPSIPVGVLELFTATGTYSNGNSYPTQATWTWLPANVAMVDPTGLALALYPGTTTITATSIYNPPGISGTASLTVNNAYLTSIAVIPANPTIFVGGTQQFIATGTYSDNTPFDITTEVSWTSSDTTVATVVNNTGLATGAAAGTTTITATSIYNPQGIRGYATLTVSPVPLVLITVTPTNPYITIGSTLQFTATGTYADGTTKDITTQVTWTSSNTTYATINSTGLATASPFYVGITTITATLGVISGSTTLTVQL